MKDSGISWIGEVPESWETMRFRQLFSFGKGLSITKDDLVEEGFPVISYGQIHAKINSGTRLCSELYRYVDEKYLIKYSSCLVKRDDFIFADTSEDYAGIGNCAFIDKDENIFAGYHTIIARPMFSNMYPQFFAYFFLTNCWRDQIRANVMGIKVFSITQKNLRNTQILFPPTSEQRAIASFLDRRCAQIDGIIADLERQIDLLKRYKKSLITETVTKGLDKNAPMKDSGVEWIGEIPEHWGVKKLKYFCIVKTGPFGTQLSADEYTLDGNPIINVKNIGYGDIIEDDLDFIPDDVKQRLSVHVLKKGDVVFGRKGSVDKHAIIKCKHDGWVQGSDCIRVRIQKGIEPEFLNYYFESQGYGEYVTINSVGSTMASVNSDILNNSVIVVPRPEEQKNIIEFLNKKLEEINRITAGKDNQLEAMKNYKQSLIYEYVTGKKRVKEVRPCPSEQTS